MKTSDWIPLRWLAPSLTIEAPVWFPFSVVCFQWTPRSTALQTSHPAHNAPDEVTNTLNARLLDAVNRCGEVFLSHTRLNGRYVMRLAIGHERTTIDHVSRAWALLREHAARLSAHQ